MSTGVINSLGISAGIELVKLLRFYVYQKYKGKYSIESYLGFLLNIFLGNHADELQNAVISQAEQLDKQYRAEREILLPKKEELLQKIAKTTPDIDPKQSAELRASLRNLDQELAMNDLNSRANRQNADLMERNIDYLRKQKGKQL